MGMVNPKALHTMDIDAAASVLEGTADDLTKGLLFHEGDVEPSEYADRMLREPAMLARALAARGDMAGAEALVREHAQHVATDLRNEVLVVRSDDFDADGYRNIVLGSILGLDTPEDTPSP